MSRLGNRRRVFALSAALIAVVSIGSVGLPARSASAHAAPYASHPITVHPQAVPLRDAVQPHVRFSCQNASASVRCYNPQQIRTAYDMQSVLNDGTDGTGRTIVIIDAYQSPTIRHDLALFDAVFGLPDPPALNIIAPNGLTPFDQNDPNQAGWDGEITLDVEWSHAIAPGATIDLVLAPSSQDADILAATKFAVDSNLGDVISQSFGEAETCADPNLLKAEHAVFQEATARGITLFASAGDQGAAQPTCDGSTFFLSASTPASDPLVTGVGGTHLNADQVTGAYGSESVWNDQFGAGGGGFSTIYERPSYQAPVGVPASSRGVPDVTYNGDVNGGVLTVWTCPAAVAPGQCDLSTTFVFIFGGTSAGSPQWAGITALADQMAGHRLGFLNEALYHIDKKPKQQSDFHDITSGNNSFDSVTGYSAAPGWDAASGLGSPDVADLLPNLIDTDAGR